MFIVVEGNIGAGKTTLARHLSEASGATFIPERFEENPYLHNFYSDRKRFAFQTELWFLLDRFNQLQNLDFEKSIFVSDYHILKTAAFAAVNLESEEMQMFNEVMTHLRKSSGAFREPDLLIYLDIPSDQLKLQVAERSREFEKDIDHLYLEQISFAYRDYLSQIGSNHQIRLTGHNELDMQFLREIIQSLR